MNSGDRFLWRFCKITIDRALPETRNVFQLQGSGSLSQVHKSRCKKKRRGCDREYEGGLSELTSGSEQMMVLDNMKVEKDQDSLPMTVRSQCREI